jgi:Holliday junction DNA helicase RuvA subunit/crossover junction endodeoxyribonuclease RuvC
MRILGIDPGIAIVGFGVIDTDRGQQRMIQYGAITTPAGLPLATRLVQIGADLEELITRFQPDEIAIEELFFSKNITTGIAVAHGRGVILYTAEKLGIPIYEYTPMQVKQAVVGYGLAEKKQVMDMTRRLLHLKAVPRPDDAADALAIAICHARSATSLLRHKDPDVKDAKLADIDCGGVGYACATTNYTLAQLKKGETAKLYTYMNVREDAVDLFGFASQNELHTFKMLIGVSGVGPKAALSILSSTTPGNLAMSVVMGDEKALMAAPGIGKKIAQRIILELKDKLAKEQGSGSLEIPVGGGIPAAVDNGKVSEASAALAVLGYSSQEIAAALKGIDVKELPLEQIIRQALKNMVR